MIRFTSPELNKIPPMTGDIANNKVIKFGLIGVCCKKFTSIAESSIKNLTFKQW